MGGTLAYKKFSVSRPPGTSTCSTLLIVPIRPSVSSRNSELSIFLVGLEMAGLWNGLESRWRLNYCSSPTVYAGSLAS